MTNQHSIISPPPVVLPPMVLPVRPASGRRLHPVVVWDVDGTLTRTDTLVPFLSRVLGPARLTQTMIDVASRVPPGRGWRTIGKAHLLYAALSGRDIATRERTARRHAARLAALGLRPDSCQGQEKARRLRRYLAAYPDRRVWVYGNGSGDLPAMALADVPVRVRPYQQLRTPPEGSGAQPFRGVGIHPAERAE